MRDILSITKYKTKNPLNLNFKGSCARNRNRTDTSVAGNRILSPARLPVPPPGLSELQKYVINLFFSMFVFIPLKYNLILICNR